jgi:hypothetical protein
MPRLRLLCKIKSFGDTVKDRFCYDCDPMVTNSLNQPVFVCEAWVENRMGKLEWQECWILCYHCLVYGCHCTPAYLQKMADNMYDSWIKNK